MTEENIETGTLEDLAERICQCVNDADMRTVEAAKLIREARSRVENGEAGKITWSDWIRKNIKLSESRLRELQRIADADDPMAELTRLRDQNNKRQVRYRNKQKAAALRNDGPCLDQITDQDPDRKSLVEWARSAPLEQIKRALSYIRQLNPPATASAEPGTEYSAEEPKETTRQACLSH